MSKKHLFAVFGLFCVAPAVAGTFVGNRSVRATIDLPTSQWTVAADIDEPPILTTTPCGGSPVEAAAVSVGGAFVGWNIVAGDTCGWAFEVEPATWTFSDGAGRTLIATVAPSPAAGSLSPSLDFANATGAPASRLVVGDKDELSAIFAGLPLGTTVVDALDPEGAAVEAMLSEAALLPY